MTITHERLREVLYYSPIVGVFEWRKSGRKIRKGGLAGAVNPRHGYVQICVDRKQYRAHRLAWFYMTGEWPTETIDHIDGDTSNNAFANLRQATMRENSHNSALSSSNTSGVKGVSLRSRDGRWEAYIRNGGGKIHLGIFSSREEAEKCVMKAREEMHGEFVNHGIHKYQAEDAIDNS